MTKHNHLLLSTNIWLRPTLCKVDQQGSDGWLTRMASSALPTLLLSGLFEHLAAVDQTVPSNIRVFVNMLLLLSSASHLYRRHGPAIHRLTARALCCARS